MSEAKRRTLINGLEHGLICEIVSPSIDRTVNGTLAGIDTDLTYECLTFVHNTDGIFTVDSMVHFEDAKPHLFPIEYLNKPITVAGYNDGKEFLPMEWIKDNCSKGDEAYLELCINDPRWVQSLPKYMYDYLVEMKFNTEGLEPKDFINAAESKVYEPK